MIWTVGAVAGRGLIHCGVVVNWNSKEIECVACLSWGRRVKERRAVIVTVRQARLKDHVINEQAFLWNGKRVQNAQFNQSGSKNLFSHH